MESSSKNEVKGYIRSKYDTDRSYLFRVWKRKELNTTLRFLVCVTRGKEQKQTNEERDWVEMKTKWLGQVNRSSRLTYVGWNYTRNPRLYNKPWKREIFRA